MKWQFFAFGFCLNLNHFWDKDQILYRTKQVDVVVSPPAFVWDPNLTLSMKWQFFAFSFCLNLNHFWDKDQNLYKTKQVDVVLSPPAFVWDPNLTLNHVTFDL